MEQRKVIPLNLTYNFPTKPETLFDAWIVPEIANQWYFKNETNRINLETDTRVAGKFLLREWDKGNIVDHLAIILKLKDLINWFLHWKCHSILKVSALLVLQSSRGKMNQYFVLNRKVLIQQARNRPGKKCLAIYSGY